MTENSNISSRQKSDNGAKKSYVKYFSPTIQRISIQDFYYTIKLDTHNTTKHP